MNPIALRTYEPRAELDAATRSRLAAECCTGDGGGVGADPSVFDRLGREGLPSIAPGGCYREPNCHPPLPDIINSLEELLANREVELDDPAMLDDHAAAVRLDENGIEVPVYAYEDIDGELFVDGASLEDINQQAIGDCYFMTALASLATTNPEAIENMITDNGNGTYTVHFGGELGDVTVDDDFAVDRNGRPLYAQVDTGDGSPELWVAVIEKAFAQASGGYGPIEFGWANEAITAMTGHDDFTVAAPSAFAPDTLHTALAEGRSVTALSFPGEKGEKIGGETGVVTNHVYAVLDVREVDGETQVRVYNPHGRGGEPIGSDAENDGAFWMSWDDFASSFRAVEVMNTPLPCAA